MKSFLLIILASGLIFHTEELQSENVAFVCTRTHKASNTCYFNFKVDGAKYTYVDRGCKKTGKKEDVVKKVKEGTLALSRDWKIECPEPKQ
jgi:hypothetical protein